MTLHNRDIMLQSRAALRGKWGLAIGGFFLYVVLLLALHVIPYLGVFAGLIFSGPLVVGQSAFFLKVVRNEDPAVEDFFSGFWNFTNAFLAYLCMAVLVLLGSLLPIVPGIMAALSYSQTFYLIADNPGMTGITALRLSKSMMVGFKWKLFHLGLRFLGWFLLGIVTLGIGFFWIGPLYFTAMAKFHEDVKQDSASRPAGLLPA